MVPGRPGEACKHVEPKRAGRVAICEQVERTQKILLVKRDPDTAGKVDYEERPILLKAGCR